MPFNFADAIAELGGPDFALRIANETRPASNYVLASILPEISRPTYSVSSGVMTIRPTMAGLSGMDSPYRPGGTMSFSSFMENTAKITNTVAFTEQGLREVQAFAREAQISGNSGQAFLIETLLNFTQKIIVQPHLDTAEYLRGQALAFGAIDWTYGDIRLQVDYGIKEGNLFDTRTTASGEAYGAADSTFWDDHRAAVEKLGYNYSGPYMHPDTLSEILSNPANRAEVTQENDTRFTLRRRVDASGGGTELSGDRRDQVGLVVYSLEGEVIDPDNPNSTINLPFMPRGRLVYTGTGSTNAFRIGQGATQDAQTGLELGFTHLAPTTERGGQMGRHAKVFTPESRPWSVVGESASNILPVLENPDKLVVLSTEM